MLHDMLREKIEGSGLMVEVLRISAFRVRSKFRVVGWLWVGGGWWVLGVGGGGGGTRLSAQSLFRHQAGRYHGEMYCAWVCRSLCAWRHAVMRAHVYRDACVYTHKTHQLPKKHNPQTHSRFPNPTLPTSLDASLSSAVECTDSAVSAARALASNSRYKIAT